MTDILWSENGELACEAHAPYRGSDSWVQGRWRPVRKDEVDEFTREVGRAPACETCRAIERNREGGAA
jgi:hypothetical protein